MVRTPVIARTCGVDYAVMARRFPLVVDTRNASRGITADNVFGSSPYMSWRDPPQFGHHDPSATSTSAVRRPSFRGSVQ